ncbi:hypothetical protein ACFC5A_35630, partial [Streptomyces yangpuensis]
MPFSHDPAPSASAEADRVPGRSPQSTERTTAAPSAAAGAGGVPGRSPQGAERTTAPHSGPENRSA